MRQTEEQKEDNLYCIFDYIMNTRKSYELLSEAMTLLVKRAKRFKRTPQQEIEYNVGNSSWPIPRWFSKIKDARIEAWEDYCKHFPNIECDEPYIDWTDDLNTLALAGICVTCLDRFEGQDSIQR